MWLQGVDEIAKYCRRSNATILSWIRMLNFPALPVRLPGRYRIYVTTTGLIDAWLAKMIAEKETIRGINVNYYKKKYSKIVDIAKKREENLCYEPAKLSRKISRRNTEGDNE